MSEAIKRLSQEEGSSKDLVAENVEKLKQLFPEIVTEGKVDFETLKEVMGEFNEESKERYSFTWNGKSQSRKLAMTPSKGTLRPAPEESVNWDSTENLFIEGDNLEVLKLLQRSYHKKVKMIYIDPPYNTGKEFIYPDDYRDNIKNFLAITKQVDSDGNKISSNPETNGRYHTNWLNMMYPRLKLARELLREDGIIFVSIDDNEAANLKKILDEVFGEENFVSQVSRATGTPTGGGGAKPIVNEKDYLLVYSKTSDLTLFGLPLSDKESSIYNKEDEFGVYLTRPLRRTGGEDRREDRPTMFYPLIAPDGSEVYPFGPGGYESRWICGKDKFEKLKKENRIEWIKGDNNEWGVYQKFYLEGRLKQAGNLWTKIEGNKKATRDIRELFDGKKVFDFPKPIGFLKKVLQISTKEDDVVLDFFAGSGSIAQAVLEINHETEENRKYICCQLPERVSIKSSAYKAGFSTISDVAKERIRRVGKNLQKKYPDNERDKGFKVFKLDTSNIKLWDPNFEDFQLSLKDSIENIKSERTEEDVIYEILLKYGLDLTIPIEERIISDAKVFVGGAGALILCLSDKIDLDVVDGITAIKEEFNPELMRVVFRDSGFKDDVVKTNAVQILKQHGIEDVRSI